MATFINSQKRFYMCPKCFNTYEFDYSVIIDTDNKDIGMIYSNNNNNISIYCAKCVNFFKEPINMFEVDPLMVPVIIELNKKGWITYFSCEGHIGPTYIGDTFQEALDKEEIEDSQPYIVFNINQIADDIISRFSEKERNEVQKECTELYDEFEMLMNNILNKNRRNCKYMINPPYHWRGYLDFNFRKLTDFKSEYEEDYNDMEIRYNLDLPEEFDDLERDKYGKFIHHDNYVNSVLFIREQIDQKEVYMADLLQWVKELPDLTKIKSFKDFRDLFHE